MHFAKCILNIVRELQSHSHRSGCQCSRWISRAENQAEAEWMRSLVHAQTRCVCTMLIKMHLSWVNACGVQGPLGKEKKERQAGKGPRLLWNRMSPDGVAGAAGEDGHCCSTMAMLFASWAPLGPPEEHCSGEGALHVPSKAAWFVSCEVILGQPHSRCYWHPSLNWFAVKAHVQKTV